MRCPSCAGDCCQGADLLPAQALKVDRASYQAYALPLKRGLTTGSTDSTRPCFLLHLTCSALDGSEAQGVGEVAPLAGLQTAVAVTLRTACGNAERLSTLKRHKAQCRRRTVTLYVAIDAVHILLQGCTGRACLRLRSSWLF